MNLSEHLNQLKEQSRELLEAEPRLTPQEIAEAIGEGDVSAVEIVLQSMYASGEIEPVYVYQLQKKE